MAPARLLVIGFVVLAFAGLPGACPSGLKTIRIDVPAEAALFEDVPPVIASSARIGANFDVATVEARVDGVDLIGELGLVWPFSDESGIVLIGGSPAMVSGFGFTSSAPRRLFFELTGLPAGSHTFEVFGERKNGTGSVTSDVGFAVTGPMTLEADAFPVAAQPGTEDFGVEGVLVNASLGQPLAAPPISLSDGGELREGFVPVSEARIAGGGP